MQNLTTHIDVLNQTTVVSDQEIIWLTAALQIQVSRDFAPVWETDAILTFVPKTATPNPTHWQLVFLDNSDQAGALGYHDLTASGLPLGKVFVKTTVGAHDSWSVTASHELMEMLGDPYIDLSVFIQDTNISGRLYAYETADAVETDSLGYVINQFKVSDFVFPNWFEPNSTGPWDFKKHCTAPLQILAGGYIGYFDVPNTNGWSQLNANAEIANPVNPKGSRREARTILKSSRLKSKV